METSMWFGQCGLAERSVPRADTKCPDVHALSTYRRQQPDGVSTVGSVTTGYHCNSSGPPGRAFLAREVKLARPAPAL